MSRRIILSLVALAAALTLAGLGHYYLLYQRVYVWDVVVFYVVAALLLAWAYRRAASAPARGWHLVQVAWRHWRAAVRGLLFRRPNRLLIGALAVMNGMAALAAFLIPPPAGLLLAGLLWVGGVAGLLAFIPWPRRTRAESAPASDGAAVVGIRAWPGSVGVLGYAGYVLIVGLASALLGQLCFFHYRDDVLLGAFFWCVAALSFGLLLWTERDTSAPGGTLVVGASSSLWQGATYRRVLRLLAGAGGALCAFRAGWLARSRLGTDGFSDLLWLWLIGVCWFLVAFAPSFSTRGTRLRLARWLCGHKVELAGLAALLLAALAVRAFDLEHIPANLSGDEGTQGAAALALLGPPLGNPFSTGWYAVPTMSFVAHGVTMRVFGETVAGLRVLSALIGASTVLTTFLLARELWGRRVAWLAVVALTFSHYHIHFSRLGSNQIADGFFTTLALWLLVRGLRSRRPLTFALAGAVTGLGWYSYFGARLVGLVIALYLAWRSVAERRFLARNWRPLLVLAGAALVVVAPLLLHFADHPAQMTSRFQQIGIFPSGWYEREQEITGRSGASLLAEQVWESVSAFNYTLDPTFWYRSLIPLLDLLSGLLFVLGLLWATARCRETGNGLLLLWFWLALFMGWMMTENPPSSMRMTGVAPALALLVGLGLNWLVELSGRLLGGERRLWDAAPLFLLVVIAVFNLRYYFVVYTPTRVYGNPTAEIATDLARYLEEQDDGYVVYFHAPPVMYWDFGTLRFMATAQGVEGVGVAEEESAEPDLNRGARFVFLPHRLSELEVVRARFPGGFEKSVISSADGRLLYTLYEVPPQG